MYVDAIQHVHSDLQQTKQTANDYLTEAYAVTTDCAQAILEVRGEV